MSDDMLILAGTCIGLALWVAHLSRKLAKAEEFGFMAMMALRDVADHKVEIARDSSGTITIKKVRQ